MRHTPIPTLVALSAALLLGAALPTDAKAGSRPPDEARWLRLEVIDRDRGQPLALHAHRGEGWVAGERGQPYTLRLSNLSGERLLVVLSVDGVNVVTGETASPAQSGYVLSPWGSAEIAGWRKSMDDVAAFRFADLPDSYAARTGRPLDVGVIGAAVFRERRPPPMAWQAAPVAPASKAAPEARALADASGERERRTQGLGTAHGERLWSPTTNTRFERASTRPEETLSLRYDDHAALMARGVIPAHRPWIARRPRAFPGGFVPDP